MNAFSSGPAVRLIHAALQLAGYTPEREVAKGRTDELEHLLQRLKEAAREYREEASDTRNQVRDLAICSALMLSVIGLAFLPGGVGL